jgi:hypothetical protein
MKLFKVTDLLQFTELTKSLRVQDKKVGTNCYLLLPDIEKLINRGKLHWMKIKNGIIFLKENQDFYNLYYYFATPIDMDECVDFSGLPKPVILDLLVKTSGFTNMQTRHEKFWKQSGFQFNKRNLRFHLDLPPGDRSSRFRLLLDPSQYDLGLARQEEIPEIIRIWRSALDPYSVALPDESELSELIRSKQVFCIRTSEKQVIAAYRLEVRGKSAYFWQVVVEKSHRERDKAHDILFSQYLLHPEVTSFYFWVDENSRMVIWSMKKLGYIQDEVLNYQYILEPK